MNLPNTIAVVTGASRGAGRGIALALGEQGATVYVTGRSSRTTGITHDRPQTETIEETAELVTARGGVGIPVRVDHTNEAEVQALFERVKNEQGRLDLLVNNAWGGNALPIRNAPFWEQSLDHWNNMFNNGVRSHILSTKFAAPLLVAQKKGLVIHTTFYDDNKYTGHLYYDLAKNAMNRLAFSMSRDLRPYNVAVLALTPSFMRTEIVLDTAETPEERAKLEQITESPEYLGRAICALAAESDIMSYTGTVQRVGDLAEQYGFTDIDGRRIPAFRLPG